MEGPCAKILTRQLHKVPAAIYKIPRAPPDKILGLTEEFNKDKNPNKTNLTVGIYKDNWGHVTTFPSVARAQMVLDQSFEMNTDLSYLPIEGCPDFQSNVLQFLYKDSCPEGAEFLNRNRISFVQTLSGTGALAVASKLLSLFMSKTVWIPNPSWPNHANVFQNNGFKNINYYTYYRDGDLDVDRWLQDLEQMTRNGDGSPQCIVLHACCHNPTGMDPSLEQWRTILDKINELNLIPIIDMAYQGLDTGDLYKDAYLLRMSLDEERYQWPNGLFLCQSFAKNMGLYGERVGSLSVVTPSDTELKLNIDSQLKKIVRGMYSSPPGYGSRVANIVLSNPELKKTWFKDVQNMADRLKYVRAELGKRLDWPLLSNKCTSHGMFLYTGLDPSKVDKLRRNHSVYLVQDGRLSLSGLNDSNINYVCDALQKVSK
ncbi:LAQU0S01e11276g1_1 [Lachancea quebecensis]|uniref:Aspartate aminotransferase n=1 Tax=Lachancea quebecensis TaxID=1654605 RepID=A0A0P1KN99_9SACH|nr:LAQU0S01e11276g1_1 [Lachancea quebecensis]